MTNKFPSYSVLMSVYINENAKDFKRSVDSMLNQSIVPNEIVIVKDGPVKEEIEIQLAAYKSKYKKMFTIVSLPKNMGLGLALNEGLKKCKHEFIVRMDSDDISIPRRVELQLLRFKANPELSICGGYIAEYSGMIVNTIREVPLSNNEILKKSKRKSPFNHVTVMFKKDDILRIGGYRDIRRKEDIDLFVRAANSGLIGENISNVLVLVKADKDYLRRRKSWENCKSYIKVVYNFWIEGYSSFFDFLFVLFSQIFMYLSPHWLMKIVSDHYLRTKTTDLSVQEVMEEENENNSIYTHI